MSPRLLPALPARTACPVRQAADAPAPAPYRSAGDIIEAAPPAAWRLPDPDNLLYLELPQGRVIIELAPQFAPEHVGQHPQAGAGALLGRHQHLPRAGQLRGAVR